MAPGTEQTEYSAGYDAGNVGYWFAEGFRFDIYTSFQPYLFPIGYLLQQLRIFTLTLEFSPGHIVLLKLV